jgi:RNA polymerase sigma-70 factor (ECF subfamily)
MSEEADGRLVARCGEGDRRAFSDLVTRYQKPIYNAALHMLHDAEDARDVTQTVFLKAYEHLDDYDPKFKFYSWIYRIALNESINALQRRHPSEELRGDEPDEHAGPDDEVGSQQAARRLQAALMTLRPDQRAVIVLRHFLDSSYEDMSEILGVPDKTVKSRLFTARQALKDALNGPGAPKHAD